MCLLTFGKASAQLIITQEDNTAWVNKLRNEKDLATQLELIRTRILADTNVYVIIGDRIVLPANHANKQQAMCRPVMIIQGEPIPITNDTERQTIESLSKELTTTSIKQLEVVDQEKALSLFGQQAWCGVILLTTTNKRTHRALLRYTTH